MGLRSGIDRLREEGGQTLVLVTLALVPLLGMAGLVVDLGRAYYVKRTLQASADAAALAGAQGLPDPGAAVGLAEEYSGRPGAKNATANVPAVTTSVVTECRANWPCNPVNAVVVDQSSEMSTFFARILGFDSFSVSARAVAIAQPGGSQWAIFAYDSDCGSFGLKGNISNVIIDGAIHSNGDFEINGNDITVDYASSHGPPCKVDVNGANIDLGGDDEPLVEENILDWPAYFTTGQFTCTYSAKKFEFNENDYAIPPGVYCASESFKTDGDNQTGNITVLAPEIVINGNNQTFTPYANNVLFFATGDKEMILNGFAYDWTGIIFHPGGRVKVNGDENSVLVGMIEAREVEVNGTAFNMEGRGPGGPGFAISLLE